MKTYINKAGYWGLLEGVYHRAVLDYYSCLIVTNEGRNKELKKFFLHNPYNLTEEKGMYIMERAKREVRKAENFIIDYLSDEVKSVVIPKTINMECIRELLRLRYTNLTLRLLNPDKFNSPITLCKKGRYYHVKSNGNV